MKTLILLTVALTSLNVSAKNYNEVHQLSKSILEKNDYSLTQASFSDIKDFCPQYKVLSQDEREDFWAHLVTTMVRYESGFNSKTSLVENNGNISRGLLQISYKSISKPYKNNGCSVISSDADLNDPIKNLKCGFAIISYLAKKDGTIAESKRGASRYWSTLRNPYSVFVKSLNKAVTVGKKGKIVSDLKNQYPVCF